jgi:hypothetical protein
MTQGISEKDRAMLICPFPRAEHEFIRGYVYITEDAINTRLAKVDPAFTFEILSITARGRQVSCHARLTVNGVARDAIGMQSIEYLKGKDGQEDVNREAGEPEKSADTDAFKRCARKHGIGLYLLQSPKEGAQFEQWLSERLAAWKAAYGHLFEAPAQSPSPTLENAFPRPAGGLEPPQPRRADPNYPVLQPRAAQPLGGR